MGGSSTPNAHKLFRAGGTRDAPTGAQYVKNKKPSVLTDGSPTEVGRYPGDTFMVDDYAPTRPISVPLRAILQQKCFRHVRRAPSELAASLHAHFTCTPLQFTGKFDSCSLAALQRRLRRDLASSLQAGKDEAAFAKLCGVDNRPRADDLERMYATFPARRSVDWSAPDVSSGLDLPLWRRYHALHCKHGCTAVLISDRCYFRFLEFFLRTGLQPPFDGTDWEPRSSTYVDLFRANEDGCRQAFQKWLGSDVRFLSPATTEAPSSCCALLPVIKRKDRWRCRVKLDKGPPKARLCLDLKTSRDNDHVLQWLFRYLTFQLIPSEVQQGDWLAVLDIDQFFMRLPAGARMRARQWFQDPDSFPASDAENSAPSHQKRWRQLLSVAFGWKVAPAFASTVSSELVRILRAHGIRVVGVYVDDLILAAATKAACEESVASAKRIMAALGLPCNDKQKGPASPEEGIVFLGILINTSTCAMSISPEHREYTVSRLEVLLQRSHVPYKDLESLAGSLTWLCEVLQQGRPRRAEVYAALTRYGERDSIPVRGALARQLHWWWQILRSPKSRVTRFWKLPPARPLCISDASGPDGWGACALGLHFFGVWPEQLVAEASPEAILFKEVFPICVVILALAPLLREQMLCAAADNAGTAFTINSLNSRDPRTRRLLQLIADCTTRHSCCVVAGHGRRHRNTHTDSMSHVLANDEHWTQAMTGIGKHMPGVYHFAVCSASRKTCMLASLIPDPSLLPAGAGRRLGTPHSTGQR